MPRARKFLGCLIVGSLVAAAGAGCQNNTQKGAAIGGVGGGVRVGDRAGGLRFVEGRDEDAGQTSLGGWMRAIA